MADLIFLTLDEVIILHRDQIRRYGGSLGIRDAGLLQSALETPKSTFGGSYLHEDIFMMAAAYLFHLVQNHAFINGNKRIGLYAALAFLDKGNMTSTIDIELIKQRLAAIPKGQRRT